MTTADTPIPRRRRIRWYVGGLSLLLGAVVVLLGLRGVQGTVEPGKIIVLVAELDGPDPARSMVSDNVVAMLRLSLAGVGDVEVRRLGRVITAQDGRPAARRWGVRQKARVVLWGRYHRTASTVALELEAELFAWPKMIPLSAAEDYVVSAVLAEPDHFTVQQILSEERGVFESLVEGLTRYEGADYPEAVQRLGAVVKQAPGSVVSPVVLVRGNAWLMSGEADLAIADYTDAVELSPADAAAHTNLGVAFAVQGKPRLAIDQYDRALALSSRQPAAYINRGTAYAVQGDHQKAIEAYTRALQVDPEDATAYLDRGASYAVLADQRRALTDFNRSLRINPKQATAYLNRGLSYAALQDYRRAVADYSRALEIDPRSVRAYYHRGVAYAFQDKNQEAIGDFSRAIQIDPRYAAAFRDRGVTHLVVGQSDKAIADASRAIEIDPNDARAYFNRGVAHIVQGDPHRGADDLNKVLEISRDPGLRTQAQDELNRMRRE